MCQYDIKNNKAELIYPLYAVKRVGVCSLPSGDILVNETGGSDLTSTAQVNLGKGRWVMNIITFSYPIKA